MIQSEPTKTKRTVPGQMVINVLIMNRVSKAMWLKAAIDLEVVSVKSLLNRRGYQTKGKR